MKVEFYNLN